MQAAYEVLSDPQERAWYDSHETAILRGDDGSDPTDNHNQPPGYYERNIGITSADDLTRLLRRFNGSVDFTDAPSGFYGFLRDTFAQLALEEEAAARQERLDPPDYPSFGHAADDYYDVVRTFYASWAGFSTRKTFAWRDRYRASDAEDRRMRRLIDKENRRAREEGVREFNDAVRALVAFVRKRDPRYTPNTQSEAERQQALKDAAAAQAARSRAANARRAAGEAVPVWAQSRAPEDNEGVVSDEESDEEQIECVACKKTFKSERQFEAHERSKKHIKAVQALRRKMQKEGIGLGLDGDGEEDEADGTSGFATPLSSAPNHAGEHMSDNEAAPESAMAEDFEAVPKTTTPSPPLAASLDNLTISPTTDTQPNPSANPPHITPPPTSPSTSTPEKDLDSASDSDSDFDSHPTTSSTPPAPSSHPPTQPQTQTKSQPTKQLPGKAAQKRQRKAAAAAAAAAQGSSGQHECAACGAGFASKTRLFQHIKDFGHAQAVSGGGGKAGGRGGRRR